MKKGLFSKIFSGDKTKKDGPQEPPREVAISGPVNFQHNFAANTSTASTENGGVDLNTLLKMVEEDRKAKVATIDKLDSKVRSKKRCYC